MTYTREALDHVKIVAEAIAVAGAEGIPSGHLYARLMSFGYSLAVYQRIIDVLKTAGLVTERAHLLTWNHATIN